VKADVARGFQPCAVVATTGSTATTAVDPLADIARVAKAYGLWMHVDAALAGSAMILPEYRNLWDGIEGADSLVTNPHKWLGASFDCSTYFVRDPEHLVRVMSTNPSFLRTSADSQAKNYRDWGIPLGRRFRALKLWFLIREQGVSRLQARLRRDIGYAQWLAARVDETAAWRRVAPTPLQTVCVRHEPAGLSGEALDAHTLGWVRRINESGKGYLTAATLDGRWMVRVAFGGEATQQKHVCELWELMQTEAARC
jgi:aromatic-L-amino-acid decarboxylase